MNIQLIAQVSLLSVLVCGSLFTEEKTDWTKHPLWVGYESVENGRTPALSGKITKEDIAKYLPENPIVIDAGAFDGNDTLEMSKLWPKGTIYSFEPMPYALERLQQKCANCSNIRIIPVALSDKTGEQTFHLSSGISLQSSSLLSPGKAMEDNHADVTFNEDINVKCFNLDAWAKLNGVTHVDFLWLD